MLKKYIGWPRRQLIDSSEFLASAETGSIINLGGTAYTDLNKSYTDFATSYNCEIL